MGYRNAVGYIGSARDIEGGGRTGEARVEKATGLWRWKKEGEREWRRPTRYLATTGGGVSESQRGGQRESARRGETHTPAQGVPGETKLGHVFAACFQFLHLLVELCTVSGGGRGEGRGE